jgi:hypothetical protein
VRRRCRVPRDRREPAARSLHIARFRQRHEAALACLFGDVLALCADAGLVGMAVLAVDGTKVHANASQHQNLDYDEIAKEILAEADAVDRAEDECFGDRRGDELPPELSTAQGRRGWLRDAKRRLDERRAAEARPVPKSRPARLREGSAACRKTTTCAAGRMRPTRPIARAG